MQKSLFVVVDKFSERVLDFENVTLSAYTWNQLKLVRKMKIKINRQVRGERAAVGEREVRELFVEE